MVTTMFHSLIACVVILLYLCMGVYIGLGWVKNLCDNTEIKKMSVANYCVHRSAAHVFFGCLYTSSYLLKSSVKSFGGVSMVSVIKETSHIINSNNKFHNQND